MRANGGEASQFQQALAAVTAAVEIGCAARLWLKQVNEANKLVSANSRVRGCPAGKIRGEQYPEQASCFAWYLVFAVKQQPGGSGCLHKG